MPAVDAQQSTDHTYDVVTLGNLCVDIFVHLEQVSVRRSSNLISSCQMRVPTIKDLGCLRYLLWAE